MFPALSPATLLTTACSMHKNTLIFFRVSFFHLNFCTAYCFCLVCPHSLQDIFQVLAQMSSNKHSLTLAGYNKICSPVCIRVLCCYFYLSLIQSCLSISLNSESLENKKPGSSSPCEARGQCSV